MEKESKLNFNYLKELFKRKRIKIYTLNKMFYYSLFDSGVFEAEAEFFPIEKIVDHRKNLKKLLRRTFGWRIKRFIREDNFKDFERKFISTDILSRLVLVKALNKIGIEAEPTSQDSFDFKIKGNIYGELKRICLWTNYSNYLDNFLSKTKKYPRRKYLYLVACTHPFVIEKIIPKEKDRALFNKYLHNMIRSHYYSEKLINAENITMVIRFIHMTASVEYSLLSLCEEIKTKIQGNEK